MLEARNISKIYENGGVRTEALSDISFKVEKGEFIAIIGPSGSGKSTLMHILGALDLPTSGKYILNGRNVEATSDDVLAEIRNKEIGFIFQSFNLLPRMSALKNVLLPMAYAGVPKNQRLAKAKEVLKVVGLEDKMENAPNQLSGGQKQRVAIARALTMEPSILLADEPTGNLPSHQSDEIIDVFEGLNKKGHTIVIITHNESIAKKTKRIITLVDGKIVSDEPNI
ncbi:macrolide ABC transporter ATP-binding protein [candidate division WWE3 bacterium RIFCSPHIGHO2_01_FULL_40_23]|uniref:Macrolide ABC transporter ATP-binding protein n=1 Tax=candidate division WWE3 bacterium RIFCSPLOWO2_01_FULL_41_18 TaxID=1802625 RepID=A0A1F4VDT7_UNCKA|nr:MAG: macrolide ABC transporter ATP-binding protein [candidate division WWE3 bacterium RIFCSPHIGHO2_01_FULL_40_23]OGC55110.1 MAG: macrolide ABC transporter ATP-binding protein [candidate division WWE3 bacterium RIFCSPLOWO2_01_FULL_41_18]